MIIGVILCLEGFLDWDNIFNILTGKLEMLVSFFVIIYQKSKREGNSIRNFCTHSFFNSILP